MNTLKEGLPCTGNFYEKLAEYQTRKLASPEDLGTSSSGSASPCSSPLASSSSRIFRATSKFKNASSVQFSSQERNRRPSVGKQSVYFKHSLLFRFIIFWLISRKKNSRKSVDLKKSESRRCKKKRSKLPTRRHHIFAFALEGRLSKAGTSARTAYVAWWQSLRDGFLGWTE